MGKGKYVFILITLGFLLYFNSLFNGFVWDDEEQVLNNTLVHSITSIPKFFSGSTFNTGGSGSLGGLYYKPAMSTSFSLIYTIFGANPFFFHLFQLLIHITNSILIFLIFRKVLTEKFSFLASLLFLIHPINTETVVYVSALQDALFMFFGLLALLFTLKPYQKINLFWISFLLLLSLLSKETGFLFLPLILIYKLIFQRKKIILYIISTSWAVGIYFFLRFVVAHVYFTNGGLSPIMRISFWERLINIPQIIFFYIRTFLAPLDLSITQHWVVTTINIDDFYLPAGMVIIFFTIILLLGLFIKQKSSQDFKIYLFFFIWTILGLGMHLQLSPLDMTVAERWFYFASAGILGMLAVILQNLELKAGIWKRIYIFIALVIVTTLFSRTFMRTFDWRNGLTLFSHDINISKNAFDLENNLGVELYRVGKFDEAKTHFKKSTELAPYWWTNWNNLGVIYEKEGDRNTARNYYQKAITHGDYYLAYENLAKILFFDDNPQNAEQFIRQSLKKLPNNSSLWLTLALTEYKLGNLQEALVDAKNSYSLSPNPQNYYVVSKLQANLPLEFK